MGWELCHQCNKPLNNEANIKLLRSTIVGGGLAGVLLGGLALPALGFGLGGIAAGSFAAGVQGPAVVAGSLFAVLQSLGATGMGILLFGSIGGAIGVVAPIAAQLGWCDGSCARVGRGADDHICRAGAGGDAVDVTILNDDMTLFSIILLLLEQARRQICLRMLQGEEGNQEPLVALP